MAKNRLSDLRDHLFEVLEGVKDGSIELDKAHTVCEVARQITAAACVQVKFMQVAGEQLGQNLELADASFFTHQAPEHRALPAHKPTDKPNGKGALPE
jgi:hypothetical protein